MMWKGLTFCLLFTALASTSAQVSTSEPPTTEPPANEQSVNENSNLFGFFDGDIVLSEEQQGMLEATSNPSDPFSPQNAVVSNARRLWPGGRVPYFMEPSLNNRAVDAINAAIETYRTESCIELVERTNEADYIRFFPGSGCFSFIGRVGGPQDISIGRGCEFEGIVLHEIFHALGRWHEQSRPDRDMYVIINSENIRRGTEGNFEIANPNFVTTQGIPYDLQSIMHYSATAFSTNRQPTIVPVDPDIPLSQLGQRQGFTERDIQHVRTLYCGDEGMPSGSWSSWGEFSECSRTCNGGTRTRTRTCEDGVDCEGSNIDTEQCNTNACPVPASWGTWTTWSACSSTCGSGSQRRLRSCVGGNNCVGRSNEFRDCNLRQCPTPASWGSWGSWSACSSTCQGGQRQRTRTCRNGDNCLGAGLEDEECNVNIPCTRPDPNSGDEWSSWSSCSVKCGGGVRFRTRRCNVAGSCETDRGTCNTQDCNPEPFLRGIRHLGCWYLNTRRGLGTLEGFTPDLSDDPQTRENPASKCGVAAQQYNFTYFGITLGYCVSGSNELSDYQYIQSRLCQDGRGTTHRGFFIMDVYEVTNSQSFADSVQSQLFPTTTTDDRRTTGEDRVSGSPGMTYCLRVLLVSMLLAVLCMCH